MSATITRRRLLQGAAACLALPSAARAQAPSETLTDVLGRRIAAARPVRRMILGEGRQIFVVGALDRKNPFGRVVGWRNDLITSDPDTWRLYRRLYPAAADIPLFNGMRDGTFDVERAIALQPDVILLNLEARIASEEGRLVERLPASASRSPTSISARSPSSTRRPRSACSDG